ncbi:MAG: hypothetical protein A2542_03145 [Parcubacteria group bacterium RIFOXYD2_FULL_52_8]|nr:MAG: hypothetical protein A2542_03145 [Parcubacteria group bacterium RIFOXYD2_FULL_52_8]
MHRYLIVILLLLAPPCSSLAADSVADLTRQVQELQQKLESNQRQYLNKERTVERLERHVRALTRVLGLSMGPVAQRTFILADENGKPEWYVITACFLPLKGPEGRKMESCTFDVDLPQMVTALAGKEAVLLRYGNVIARSTFNGEGGIKFVLDKRIPMGERFDAMLAVRHKGFSFHSDATLQIKFEFQLDTEI